MIACSGDIVRAIIEKSAPQQHTPVPSRQEMAVSHPTERTSVSKWCWRKVTEVWQIPSLPVVAAVNNAAQHPSGKLIPSLSSSSSFALFACRMMGLSVCSVPSIWKVAQFSSFIWVKVWKAWGVGEWEVPFVSTTHAGRWCCAGTCYMSRFSRSRDFSPDFLTLDPSGIKTITELTSQLAASSRGRGPWGWWMTAKLASLLSGGYLCGERG